MSQELLKTLLLDSEAYCTKFKKDLHVDSGKAGKKVHEKSKKIKKEGKTARIKNQNTKKNQIISDRLKNVIKKMKISTDKNLILEKNINHLRKINQRAKVKENVSSFLVEKLGK